MDHEAIARDLQTLVDGQVRFGRHDRMLYATDASIYQVEPIGVVVPRTIRDAERVVRYCARQGLPLLPRGGGTSLAGQAVNVAVILDFSPWCRRVAAIDPLTRTAVVEPGVVLDDLNRAAAAHGLMFGPDVATATHATIGGMIGNNSAGAHSILYGRTVEHLDAVDVLLADGTPVTLSGRAGSGRAAELARGVADIVRPLAGEIRDRYPTTIRRVNGYNLDLVLDTLQASAPVNLAQLVCGAEGTLAVVTGATLRLVAVPPAKALAIAAFAGLDDALSALGTILATGPSAVELIDDTILELARSNVECRRCLELLPSREGGGAPAAVLYIEYFADDDARLEDRLADLAARLGDVAVRRHTDPEAMAAAWALRRAGEPLLHAVPGDRKPLTFIEDTAVDPKRLPEFVDEFRRIVTAHGTTAAYYAHASVGCLHIRPMISLRDPAGRAAMQTIAHEVTDLVKSYGGALSGEHGDGRARSHLLRRFYGDAICDGFGRIKNLFDPEHRLNPGNIVDGPPMTEALRVEPADRPVAVPRLRTYYRYDREQGFGSAVEMCNGAGVCRKTRGGTMCPSYRALRDERHATRGRANALRLAITGQFGADGAPAWDDPATIETLNLCLSCKACKAECPSNVDIARVKAEYTAQRFTAAGRVPRRVRRVGRVRRIQRIASSVAPLVNTLTSFAPTAALVKGLLGVDRRRSLPRCGRPLGRWLARRDRVDAGRPAVVLLPDCFTVYGEPHIGQAAVRVLEALGYRVVLPRNVGCCGRALISVGMLAEAQQVCRASAEALLDCLARERDAVVVGCEPSCVSAITDDWIDLDLGIEPARLGELAGSTMLVEHFVESRRHPEPVAWTPGTAAGEVLLHGHCHQKALWGIDSSAGLLRRLVGDRLGVLDTGCCGMAGLFGYEHYELSMAIAELDLLPSLRSRPDATIAAPGTSCRHQIRDATGREAVHPIEIAAWMLGGPRSSVLPDG